MTAILEEPPQQASQPPSTPPRQRHSLRIAALLAAGVLTGAGITHQLWHPQPVSTVAAAPSLGSGSAQQPGSAQAPGTLQDPQASTGAGPANAAAIASDVNPGVVDINTTIGYQNARAAGTGMVLTSTGEVLTNNHVISGATSISVTDVGNGKTYDATVVGYDRTHDVAVLQLQGASGLQTVRTSSQETEVGTGVVGIGNAGGAGGTPSYAGGVITAVGQSITATDDGDGTSQQLTGLLETNADIVAGDSGGPLVNTDGEVVGMDTAASASFRFSESSQAYAIPISTALQIAQQIENGSASTTVHIGATAMLGVGVQSDGTITQVVSSGPAAAAGLVAGDTIVSVARQPVSSADALSAVMLQQSPGRSVSVGYVDSSGGSRTTTVHLATGPPQ